MWTKLGFTERAMCAMGYANMAAPYVGNPLHYKGRYWSLELSSRNAGIRYAAECSSISYQVPHSRGIGPCSFIDFLSFHLVK